MKTKKKYVRLAVMHTLLELYKMKDVANLVVDIINKEHDESVELQTVKSGGFTIRRTKEFNISDKELCGIISDAITELLDDKLDEVLDYISENYDFAYESDMVNEEFVQEIFDITRSGRLVYVDADI